MACLGKGQSECVLSCFANGKPKEEFEKSSASRFRYFVQND